MSPIIKALIVDDEQDARDGLENLIKQAPFPLEVVAKAVNAQNALELIIDQNPELIFLDINMPEKDGFWLADKLHKLHLPVNIIFVTAYDEYAIQAIRFAAFDFLTKPVTSEILEESLNRYMQERIENNFAGKMDKLRQFLNQQKLKVVTRDGFKMIPHNSIIYCLADRNYTTLYLSNGKTEVVCMQLGTMEENLVNPSFVRISRSALINLDYLEQFNRKDKLVVLTDMLQKYEIKISSSGLKKLMDKDRS